MKHRYLLFVLLTSSAWAACAAPDATHVTIISTDNPPTVVAAHAGGGVTFCFQTGGSTTIWRLTTNIVPHNNDSFVGDTACNTTSQPTGTCVAVLRGSQVIVPVLDVGTGYFKIGGQTQHGGRTTPNQCASAYGLGCQYPEDVFFDGTMQKHIDCITAGCNAGTPPTLNAGEWWFDYSDIDPGNGGVIWVHDNPGGHTVETSIQNNAFGGTANNVTFQYLAVEQFADMFPTGAIGVQQSNGTQLTNGLGWIVQNIECSGNHGYCVRELYQMHILTSNLHHNGSSAIGGGIGDTADPVTQSTNAQVLVQANTVANNNLARFAPGNAGGIKVGSTTGITFRNNNINNNIGGGIHLDVSSGANSLADGNTITDNTDGTGFVNETGLGPTVLRNNQILRNGQVTLTGGPYYQFSSITSPGLEAYCNVAEQPNFASVHGWTISASNRGFNPYPPLQYLISSGNSFHHNAFVWDVGAGISGDIGFSQNDTANQPNFFSLNTAPDSNTYHMNSTASTFYKYDNNNSGSNTSKTFAQFQAAGADVNGSADTVNTSSWPTVTITSPADQATFNNSTAVAATASDVGSITKAELYLDWVLKQTINTAGPFSFTLSGASAGLHTVAVMAYSAAGVRNCNAVTLNNVPIVTGGSKVTGAKVSGGLIQN